MKPSIFIIIIAFLLACNNNEQTTESTTENTATETNPVEKHTDDALPVNVSDKTLATLDMGYTFRLHEMVRFRPSEIMTKMFKLDDSKNDFYIIDASVENTSSDAQDTGRDMLSVYFKLSDGSTIRNSLSLLSAYNADNKPKYSQDQYDQLWSSKFPSNSTARSHLFAANVPEGVTVTGIGFYEKNPAKNKYSDLN